MAAIALAALARSPWLGWAPIPQCGLQRWLDLPCPLCGGTRAMSAIGRLEWLEALRLNPLVCVAWAGLCLWSLGALVDWARGTTRMESLLSRGSTPVALALGAALLGANWAYLLWVGL